MEDAHYLHLLESLETTQQQEHGPEDTRRSVHGQFVPPSEETHARDIPGPGPAHTTHDARLSRALSSSILEQLPPAARKTLAQGRQACSGFWRASLRRPAAVYSFASVHPAQSGAAKSSPGSFAKNWPR
jgi:hypothetical protein